MRVVHVCLRVRVSVPMHACVRVHFDGCIRECFLEEVDSNATLMVNEDSTRGGAGVDTMEMGKQGTLQGLEAPRVPSRPPCLHAASISLQAAPRPGLSRLAGRSLPSAPTLGHPCRSPPLADPISPRPRARMAWAMQAHYSRVHLTHCPRSKGWSLPLLLQGEPVWRWSAPPVAS